MSKPRSSAGASTSYVDSQIATEAATRSAADASEASTRASAITTEAAARDSAIATAIATEVAARNAAIAAVKQVRAGHTTIGAGDITLGVVAKRIDFAVPMPAASTYQVMPISNGLAGSFSTSAWDVNGFTLNISAAVVGTVGYIAVQE